MPQSRFCTFALIALVAAYSLWSVRPPAVIPATAPPTEFSAERALAHVRAIARQPHPVGSVENARVRDYLVEQLKQFCPDVQIHRIQAMSPWSPDPVMLENIVGRIAGTSGGRAIMLLCHYDSVPYGPGAADDAAGVAAVLETIRAIRAGPPLDRDLIVLITDGEEAGLLGAHLFVAEHPWLADVALVMNFEARGRGGPVVLMQTGHDNGLVVQQFARAAPHPFGSSFAEDVFRRMPNDTDFTVFRNAGKTGLNFAFFKGVYYYHTALDTVENLDQRSLQHHGSYCLALTRQFGGLPLDSLSAPDRVFFDLFGRLFVHYPLSWSVPITALASLVFGGALGLGLHRRRFTLLGICAGFVTLVVAALLGAALVAGSWWVVSAMFLHANNSSHGDVAWSDGLGAVTVLLAVATFVSVHAIVRRWVGVEDRSAGALVAWLMLAIFVGCFVPRGHYLFAWPLLFGSVGLLILVSVVFERSVGWRWGAVCASVLPAIVLMVPSIYLISITVGSSLSWAVALCIALLLGALTVPLDWIFFGRP